MTSTTLVDPAQDHGSATIARSRGQSATLAPAVLWGLGVGSIVALLIGLFHSGGVGSYVVDPDDALRLDQTRDWLAGQAWGDVGQHRLQPGGTAMHWSRVDDLPVAAVIVSLRGWVGQAAAERAAMIAWPLVLVPAVFAIVAALCGKGALRLGVGMATLCSGALLTRFMPGRIDHHAIMTTTALMACATLLLPARRAWGAVAGVATALCLAVGFEDLAPLGLLGVAVGLLWAIGGEREYPLGYGIALAVGTAVAEILFVPDAARLATACDCLSGGWPAAMAVAGLGMALAAARGRGMRLPARMATLTLTGASAAAALALSGAGRCLSGPYPDLSATAKSYWLYHVGEMEDVLTWANGDWRWLVPSILGVTMAAGLCQVAFERGRRPTLRQGCYLALLAASALLGFRYVRSSGLPIALAAPVAARGIGMLMGAGRASRGVAWGLAFAATIPALLLVQQVRDDVAPGGEADPNLMACESKGSWSEAAALPPGMAVAPIDIGPDVLAFTPHSVLSAGIHRAFVGLDEQYRFMQGTVAEALQVAERDGINYVLWCDGLSEIKRSPEWNPHGMAARLGRREFPDWLVEIPGHGEVKIARVLRPALPAARAGIEAPPPAPVVQAFPKPATAQ